MNVKQIVLYDKIRFLGILLVVIGHCSWLEYTVNPSVGGYYFNWILDANPIFMNVYVVIGCIKKWIYSFHMPLFFFLSGAMFAITSSKRSLSYVLKKKIDRLIIPYFVAGLFCLLPIKYICGYYSSDTVILGISAFLQLQGELQHLWFLPALFWATIFFVLIYRINVFMGGMFVH